MSKEVISTVIFALATFTLAAQVFIIFFAIVLLLARFDKSNKAIKQIVQFFSEHSLSFAFLISVGVTLGSLYLSEIAHFVPCKLCWFQRIFMYPQVLLLGVASVKNDFGIKKYIIPMSVVGFLIAVYQYVLQMSPIPLPCTDEIASCAVKEFVEFGYITIPMMSLTSFLLILILMALPNRKYD